MPSKDVVKLFCFQRAATTYYYPHSSSPFHRRRWKPTILRKIKQSILSYQSTKKCRDETDSIVVQLRAGLEASSAVVRGGGGNGQGGTRVSLHVYQRHGSCTVCTAELNELEDRWSRFRAIKDFRSLISSSNRSLMASLPA